MCKLEKLIYDIKQSFTYWYPKIHYLVMKDRFLMLYIHHSIYIKRRRLTVVLISSYVDDMLISENSVEFHTKAIVWLLSLFEMKYIGEVSYIFGVRFQEIIKRGSCYFC